MIRRTAALIGFLCALLGVGTVWLNAATPSHSRSWRPEQERLPEIEFADGTVNIRNVRDFTYRGEEDFTPAYRNASYDLDAVERVWFVLSPFNRDWRGPAHIFLTFGFADGRYLGISAEARRETDEEFSIWRGALRRYELMYVIAEERDLIGLRAVTWDDPVYLYPIRATPEQARSLLVQLLERARSLQSTPEFYNTLTNNCTTNILEAVNAIASEPIPYGWEILLPGYSDRLAHERGLIDTDLPLESARERFRINERAKDAMGSEDFSALIRAL